MYISNTALIVLFIIGVLLVSFLLVGLFRFLFVVPSQLEELSKMFKKILEELQKNT